MSDPTLFDIDFKNELPWVWTTLNSYADFWQECDKKIRNADNGGNVSDIGGATLDCIIGSLVYTH